MQTVILDISITSGQLAGTRGFNVSIPKNLKRVTAVGFSERVAGGAANLYYDIKLEDQAGHTMMDFQDSRQVVNTSLPYVAPDERKNKRLAFENGPLDTYVYIKTHFTLNGDLVLQVQFECE